MNWIKNNYELLETVIKNDFLNKLAWILEDSLIKELEEIHTFDLNLLIKEISKITNTIWRDKKITEIIEIISWYLIESDYNKEEELFWWEYWKQLLLDNIRDIISNYQKLLGYNNTYRRSLYSGSKSVIKNTQTFVWKQIN